MSFQNSYRCSLDITLLGIILINIHQFMKVRNSSTMFHTHTYTMYTHTLHTLKQCWRKMYTHLVNLKFNQSWKENLLLYSLNIYFQVTHCAPIQEGTDSNLYLFGPTWKYDYNLSKNLSIFLLFFQVGSKHLFAIDLLPAFKTCSKN